MIQLDRLVLACLLVFVVAGSADGQFFEDFDHLELPVDSTGVKGWSFFAGDGEATIDFKGTGEGYASIVVDATRDRKNIWWALIRHRVSEQMDLERLVRKGWELRVEVRIRTSHAPRRVNLHLNTQRTTDFHSHLMEFDIPKAGAWRTISMTTRDFPGKPGDTIFAQMALMDWGFGTYRVDVDYFKVDIVGPADVEPDLGEPLPYHPPIPDPESFGVSLQSVESAVIDVSRPGVHLENNTAPSDADSPRILTVGESKWVILRWEVDAFWGRRVVDGGLLELTTHEVIRGTGLPEDSGLVRVVEILGGNHEWTHETVTLESLTRGLPIDEVFNPQMIIDWAVTASSSKKTWFTIPRPVLQRLVDGRTLGFAIRPLDRVDASFFAEGGEAPRLLFNIQE